MRSWEWKGERIKDQVWRQCKSEESSSRKQNIQHVNYNPGLGSNRDLFTPSLAGCDTGSLCIPVP